MKTIVGLAIIAASLLAAGGCGSSAPPQTSKDVQNFEGGPMPADFRKQFEDRQKQSQQKIGSVPH